jgi:pimeloyl-ACP methyl ester carboxylesterase
VRRAVTCLAVLLAAACRAPASDGVQLPSPPAKLTPANGVAQPAAPMGAGPIRIELLDPNESPPTFVMRGGPHGAARLVFLHGMCGHGLGYAQAFQFSAAAKGRLIAPQGDVSCGGVWSKWSADVAALDARITRAFRALGDPDPTGEVVIMGMSQGATRAAALARTYPLRYTRLIAMDGPTALQRGELRGLRGAVLMAGERDRQDLMRASQRALSAGNVPATFMLIPQATHGAMGPTPEQTMGQALDWLWGHSRP